MSVTWSKDQEPPKVQITPMGWVRVALRGVPLLLVILTGLICMALLRLIERPLYGLHRPWTPTITVVVCRMAFFILGMGHHVQGVPMTEPGAVVANHSSWLDIFSLNAAGRLYFVSKAEVAKWPGIGLLAKITGTVFIERNPRQAQQHQQMFEDRLLAGHKLLFFPEGTSTDGFRVLPFKTTLFQAFLTEQLRPNLCIQPVSVVYTAPDDEDPRFYGWWGEMDFASHLIQLLASRKNGAVQLTYHTPVRADAFASRKELAAVLESEVRNGMPEDRQQAG